MVHLSIEHNKTYLILDSFPSNFHISGLLSHHHTWNFNFNFNANFISNKISLFLLSDQSCNNHQWFSLLDIVKFFQQLHVLRHQISIDKLQPMCQQPIYLVFQFFPDDTNCLKQLLNLFIKARFFKLIVKSVVIKEKYLQCLLISGSSTSIIMWSNLSKTSLLIFVLDFSLAAWIFLSSSSTWLLLTKF